MTKCSQKSRLSRRTVLRAARMNEKKLLFSPPPDLVCSRARLARSARERYLRPAANTRRDLLTAVEPRFTARLLLRAGGAAPASTLRPPSRGRISVGDHAAGSVR